MAVTSERSMTPNIAPPSTMSVFSFTAPGPQPKLHFPPPNHTTIPRKRCRAVADVDGEHSSGSGKKKRRLRRFLVTSRLSLPFSYPATNIVDRGPSKIAVWAKQKSTGRELLRKAAILNRIRQRQISPPILPAQSQEVLRQTFLYGAPDTSTHPIVQRSGLSPVLSPNFVSQPAVVRGPSIQREDANDPNISALRQKSPSPQVPRRDYTPLPPSPLGLSNYDALDLEEDYGDDDDDGGCTWSFGDTDEPSQENHDTVNRVSESVLVDHDSVEAFASPETTALMEQTTSVDLLRHQTTQQHASAEQQADISSEKERQKSFAFVRFDYYN
ncbi:hypothetical protein EJ05DRAFT_471744 [Pseudovirgaria hyperparasitica]|uniref:Uncharacterized protein n=1 Tax=Pseudovirgaria hyperparasitica TaxID=470096 RepID=A0A6A6WKT6_9PEZI|nr:uncharacterized protein EJ05DRAFT_471744 [Pseudovirgaria hyperparasitica]KAF2762783.1 hypothetical protein EJ05DRAFT_471744 [Pseudovirgaria hyperparasitica]